jgi:hypothetical protein
MISLQLAILIILPCLCHSLITASNSTNGFPTLPSLPTVPVGGNIEISVHAPNLTATITGNIAPLTGNMNHAINSNIALGVSSALSGTWFGIGMIKKGLTWAILNKEQRQKACRNGLLLAGTGALMTIAGFLSTFAFLGPATFH